MIEEVWVCYCSCHENDSVMHCIPCCSTCSRCGERIKRGYGLSHEEVCPPKAAELAKPREGG